MARRQRAPWQQRRRHLPRHSFHPTAALCRIPCRPVARKARGEGVEGSAGPPRRALWGGGEEMWEER